MMQKHIAYLIRSVCWMVLKKLKLKDINRSIKMVLKCKNQVPCEACKEPIKVGQWYDVLVIDHHNMGHTHKSIFVHEACRQRAIEEMC
jgi:hypothetical protein